MIRPFLRYRLWDGQIGGFAISKDSISVKKMGGYVHLSVKNVGFNGVITVQAQSDLLRLNFSGQIRVSSQNTRLEVTLKRDDLLIYPVTELWPDLDITFTDDFGILNYLKPVIQRTVSLVLYYVIPKRVSEIVDTKLNPLLRKARQSLVENIGNGWIVQTSVQEKYLQIALKPTSEAGVLVPVRPIDKMICADIFFRDILLGFLSTREKKLMATHSRIQLPMTNRSRVQVSK
ncbi:unnamed protein product [Strongylus vulgaris]|uniref:Lipid-binding serum glycoprotein N-terminal domain-containing protein n=1 Tax=Strongylus vulgaris TaxID=40348 RepID=A0A3P7K7Z3_STRVU|nr:unnamed protein product [Strongylus vulgaris]